MKYWFTADCHFGHANIIKYCNRPFKDVLAMNRTIITNWNERVKKEDVVFHVGDFCFKNSVGGKKGEGEPLPAVEYEKKLNGKIIFIKGNHDKNNSCKTPIERLFITYGGKLIGLVHDSEKVVANADLYLVGHTHQNWKFQTLKINENLIDVINVGVDVWNFRPVDIDEILKHYYFWKKEVKNEMLLM